MNPSSPEPSMQLLAEAAQNETRSLNNGTEDIGDQDDRSSSLSDLDDNPITEETDNHNERSSQVSDEEDTEAETERLEESPLKTRIQQQVLLSSGVRNNGGASSVENTSPIAPSPEPNVALKNEDHGGYEGEAMLPTSDTSSPPDSGDNSEPESPGSSTSKKRKRIDEDDTTATSLKKVALELANHVADGVGGTERSDTPPRAASLLGELAMEEREASEDEVEQSSPEDHGDEEDGPAIETSEHQDHTGSPGEDVDMDEAGQEPDAVLSARSEEELMRKKTALDLLSKIETEFALLRDKLFADKTLQLAEELATVQSSHITHPEYLAMAAAIDQQMQDRYRHAQVVYNYKLQTLQNGIVASRSAMHGAYMQAVGDLREDALEKAGEELYQIQRGRRKIDEEEKPMNHFTPKHSDLIAQHTAYNTEVSVLSGVAKYVGFPAAPPIEGASATEIEEDLRAMGIARQPTSAPLAATMNFTRQRPAAAAEEQFLEQTPWANPQHPAHMMNNSHRQLSNHMRPASPFTTPLGQKRNSDAHMGSASTIAAFPSSSLAPTPMSAEPGSTNVHRVPSALTTATFAETPSRPSNPVETKGNLGPEKSTVKVRASENGIVKENGPNSLESDQYQTNPQAYDESRQAPQSSPRFNGTVVSEPATIQENRHPPSFSPRASLQTGVEVGNA